MRTPTPPNEFQSWLDYAIATMDVRGAYLDRIFEHEEMPSQAEIRDAAQQELDHLRQKSVMPWVRILENWRPALLKRLGRPADDASESSSLVTDFPIEGVRIQFEDGTVLNFRHAFYLGMTQSDMAISSEGAIHRVVVFTEHCGYHEFWIGPEDRIEMVTRSISEIARLPGLIQSLNEANQVQVVPYQFGHGSQDAWDQSPPVGREFGSPDYERLTQEDAAKFKLDLQAWIKDSEQYIGCEGFDYDLKEFASAAHNIQLALHELGQDVSVEVAASVWIHYSQSLCASWMAGAETVASAARALYLNCPRK
jgi:hypothetical protein